MNNKRMSAGWYAWYALALVLAAAAIVLLVLAIKTESGSEQSLLIAGQLCANIGLILCLWRNRRNRGKSA